MLNFIGRGGAFNTAEGNNSAFIKHGKHLLLIDCGSDTFSSLQRLNLLDNIEDITVIITHTHPDHIGSLGDLIFYNYYAMGQPGTTSITLVAVPEAGIMDILKGMGVSPALYSFMPLRLDNWHELQIDTATVRIKPKQSNHTFEDYEEFPCISFYMSIGGANMYYSADSREIPDHLLTALQIDTLQYVFQDVCSSDYPGNVHLSYRELKEKIPENKRHLIQCMHLDKNFDYLQAQIDGFSIVRRYGS